MAKLILIRHGQSVWNAENRFTGWVDTPLSEQGREEAKRAGDNLAAEGIHVDLAFTSTLRRAIDTGRIVLDALGQNELEQEQAWQLNERYYGALTGRNKQQTREEFGDEQVHIWRRSFDVPPPGGESLKNTTERALPYYFDVIVPVTREVETVMIAAHGNSLRGLCKELDGISDEEIPNLEIPLGIPLVYDMEDGAPVNKRTIEAAVEARASRPSEV